MEKNAMLFLISAQAVNYWSKNPRTEFIEMTVEK